MQVDLTNNEILCLVCALDDATDVLGEKIAESRKFEGIYSTEDVKGMEDDQRGIATLHTKLNKLLKK